MATTLYLKTDSSAPTNWSQLDQAPLKLDGSASGGWNAYFLDTTRGSGLTSLGTTTVTGPKAIEAQNSGKPIQWVSPALSAAATISGTVTFNVWALESAMTVNAGCRAILQRLQPDGTITNIADSSKGVELGTAAAVQNWTATPTSTSMAKGDRLRLLVVFTDAGGTMAAGVATLGVGATSAGVNGDSWVQTTENLTFMTTDPTTTTVYLTDTASSVNPGSAIEKEAWTSRGGGAVNSTTTVPAVTWTAPVQATATAGGTAIEWFTRPLTAFTLQGPVLWFLSHQSFGGSCDVEIAVCANDGTSPVVWQRAGSAVTLSSGTTKSGYLVGPDLAVTEGQRIRIRIYGDDYPTSASSGGSMIFGYAGAAASSGDTYLVFGQALTESSGAQAVTLGLLDGAPALYAPTVTPTNGITLGLIDAANALYAPTVTPTNGITLGLIDAGPALYAPTLTVGPVGITLGLLDAGPALYAPTITPKNSVTLGLIDASPQVYAPTITTTNALVIPLLDAGPATYAPTITTGGAAQTITLGALDAVNATYAPTLGLVNGAALPLLDAGPALYAPLVTPTNSVTLGLLDAAAALYAPTLAVGPVTVALGFIDAANATYAPTLAPKNTLTVPLLDAAPATYAPSVGFTLAIPLLDAGSATYAPTVTQASGTQAVTLGLLDAANATYAPTVTPKNALTVPLLDASSALYAPVLGLVNGAALPLLDAGAALYQPLVTPGPVIVQLDLVDGAPALYAPTLTQVGNAQTLTAPLLDSSPALYPPALGFGLAFPLLDGAAALYPPTVANAQATLVGFTRDARGTILPGCTVHVFRTADDVEVGQATSNALGVYAVAVQPGVAHYVVAYKAGSPDLAGTTVNTLVGV